MFDVFLQVDARIDPHNAPVLAVGRNCVDSCLDGGEIAAAVGVDAEDRRREAGQQLTRGAA